MQTPVLKVFTGSRLPSLDALRFCAALQVVFYHGGLPTPVGDGVTYFLVLSGFLFSWMFQSEWAKYGTINFKRFYLRRTFRIIPAFYIAVLFTIASKFVLHLPVDYHHALAAVSFLGNYYNAFHGHHPTGFAIYWSLGLEEQFYVLWPMCFVFFMTRGARALLHFLVTTILVVCAWRSVLALGYGVQSPYLYNAFDTRFDSLAVGCLLGLLVMSPRSSPILVAIASTGFEPFLTVAATVAFGFVPEPVRYSVGFTVQAALMGVLIVQLMVLHDHPMWRWLNHRLLSFLGTLSYSTYLYHGWGLAAAGKVHGLPAWPRVLLGLLVSLALAYVSYRLVERPALWLRRRAEARWLTARRMDLGRVGEER